MNLASLVPTITDVNLVTNYLEGKALYAHLITELPGLAVEVVAGCSVAQGGNYAPLEMANVQVRTAVNGGVVVVADPVTWLSLTTDGTPLVGVSIFVQQGFSPSVSDWLFSSLAFVDSAGLPTTITPDGNNLPVALDAVPLFRTRHGQ
jgi:hypothetical protein